MLRVKKIYVRTLLTFVVFCFIVRLMYANFPRVFLDSKKDARRFLTKDGDTKGYNSKDIYFWNNVTRDDRILKQMSFIPSGANTKSHRVRNIFLHIGAFQWNVPLGDRVFISQNCPVKSCTLLDVTTVSENVTIDAYLLNALFAPEDANEFLQFKDRHSDQIWIYFSLESPLATPDYFNPKFNDVINWTATYRRDSTIVAPYYKWHQFKNASFVRNTRNYAIGKKNKVAMFLSNCQTDNRRLDFAHELARYVHVDIYGSCGSMACPRNKDRICFETLKRDYKFYLSFENANCRDYITEKFFLNALSNDVVPIVMGAHPRTYKMVAPANSYIHVEEFRTVKDLAVYMHKLMHNDELYNKYFAWKGTGQFINTKFWCRLCSMLHDDKKPRMSVPNLDEWWRPEGVCRTWPDERWDGRPSPIKDTMS